MSAKSMLFLAVVAISGSAAATGDLLWLSEAPPKRSKIAGEVGPTTVGKTGESLDAAIGGEDGGNLHGGSKRLWLRLGDDPAKADYLSAADSPLDIELLDARGQRSRVALAPANGLAQARCEFSDLGFYNAYLSRSQVQERQLRVQLAKAELLKGSCCMKPGDVPPEQTQAIHDPAQPLEIVREHEPDEKLFTRIVSGDQIVFTIRRLGQPAPGVPVTLMTQEGWQKRLVSDKEGRARFTMIRDYFPAWNEFRRLTKRTFLAVAEVEENSSGSSDGQTYDRILYQATLSGRYAVSPYDYKSYAWGLGVTLFVVSFGGLGVYLYRRRRLKPFKEVRFDDAP